jgi:hypothetical protein
MLAPKRVVRLDCRLLLRLRLVSLQLEFIHTGIVYSVQHAAFFASFLRFLVPFHIYFTTASLFNIATDMLFRAALFNTLHFFIFTRNLAFLGLHQTFGTLDSFFTCGYYLLHWQVDFLDFFEL